MPTYRDVDLALTPEHEQLKHDVHAFAREVLRPAASALDPLPPERVIAPGSRLWDALPAAYKGMLECAGAEAWHATAAKYDVLNPPALRRLIAAGTQLRPYPREVMAALYKAAQELYVEIGEQNARFKRIHEHWDKFRVEQSQWFRVAEDSATNFLAAASAPR